MKSKQIHCDHCRHALRQLNLDPEDTKLCKEDIVKAKILQATNMTAEEEQELKRATKARRGGRKIKCVKAKIQEKKRKRVEGILNELKRKAASDAMMPERRRRMRRAGETNEAEKRRRTMEKEEDSSSSMAKGFHGKEMEEEMEEMRALKSIIKQKRLEAIGTGGKKRSEATAETTWTSEDEADRNARRRRQELKGKGGGGSSVRNAKVKEKEEEEEEELRALSSIQ